MVWPFRRGVDIMVKMVAIGTGFSMYVAIVRFSETIQQNSEGFFASPSGVVTLAVLTVLASGCATYFLRTVPKQLYLQIQVRDAILGNKERKEPGLIDDVATLKDAFREHLESREKEMTGIHEDIAGIHRDLAAIKEIVMPRGRRRRW